ncbi:carboxypeptidase-like regulatory domain-containing protein [Mesorhizobium sp. BE184]|uniref:carboxypeptidase-like regulatory domain-containing protein n=1 Tax=Mesorhizobium sp. BE184 TaxID=2817714 RepID=UPI0028640D0B|nr:carboxypeptidase-like regulatory domain-containing protein [Mesorhizobium sp. BE184]MDR7034486.1 hypothetical protein [Mesorhizobium sp. BE184]
MALGRWQAAITDANGNILPGASVEVRSEATGALVPLYSDRAGNAVRGNPFQADADGYAFFHTAGGAYRVTATLNGSSREWRYVAVGLAQETDFTLATPAGEWDVGATYAIGQYVYWDGSIFISRIDGNIGNEPDSVTPGDTTQWMFAGGSATQGPRGPAGTIEVGTVTTVDDDEPAAVENVGTEEEAILNFDIPRGAKGFTGPVGEQGEVFDQFGVDIYTAAGISPGSYYTDLAAAADATLTRLYARLVDADPGGELTFALFVAGAMVGGPYSIAYGDEINLSGLDIDVPSGSRVSIPILAVMGGVRAVYVRWAGEVSPDLTVKSSDGSVTNIIKLTQAEYDLIETPDPETLYIIVD